MCATGISEVANDAIAGTLRFGILVPPSRPDETMSLQPLAAPPSGRSKGSVFTCHVHRVTYPHRPRRSSQPSLGPPTGVRVGILTSLLSQVGVVRRVIAVVGGDDAVSVPANSFSASHFGSVDPCRRSCLQWSVHPMTYAIASSRRLLIRVGARRPNYK
jgi:hypothetical protein